MRSFNFHYNKPASSKAERNKLTVHYAGACHIVDRVICKVQVESRDRKDQPRCVMAGRCNNVVIGIFPDGLVTAVID